MTMSCVIKDKTGSMSTFMAIGATVLVLGIVAATDYAQLYSQRAKLQDAADMSALAGAAKLGNGGRKIEEFSEEQARKMSTGTNQTTLPGFSVVTTVNTSVETVKVDLEADVPGFFTEFLSSSTNKVAASATAKVIRDNIYCMMALNPTASQAFDGNGSAIVQGLDCSIYVGSSATDALSNSGTITADDICVVGGYTGTGYSVPPQTGCPAASDPFAYLSIPVADAICDYTNLNLNTSTTLFPGNYCGGLRVSGSGTIIDLAPGTYFMNNGDLKVSGSGSVQGTDVVFVLSGSASIDISGTGFVSTTPPTSGPLEGFSVVQDRIWQIRLWTLPVARQAIPIHPPMPPLSWIH